MTLRDRIRAVLKENPDLHPATIRKMLKKELPKTTTKNSFNATVSLIRAQLGLPKLKKVPPTAKQRKALSESHKRMFKAGKLRRGVLTPDGRRRNIEKKLAYWRSKDPVIVARRAATAKKISAANKKAWKKKRR